MENSSKPTHPDFPWGFYCIGEIVCMVTNGQYFALKNGTAILDAPAGSEKVFIVPTTGKRINF